MKLFEAGMFLESLPMAEDYDMWLKLARTSTFYFLDECLGEFCLRLDSITSDINLFTKCVMAVIHSHFNKVSSQYHFGIKARFQFRKARVLFESALGAYYRKRWWQCLQYSWKYFYTNLFLDFNEFSKMEITS